MRSAFLIVVGLVAAACSTSGADPRPVEGRLHARSALDSGFATRAGVADPYEDGKRHLIEGRYQTAVQRFGQALTNDRRSLDALNGLAIAYAHLGRFDAARALFERALEIDATSGMTLNNYGRSLIEQGRFRDAKPFLEVALHHAAEADAAVIAQNIESIGRARRPAVVTALREDRGLERRAARQLVRVATNVHRLETGLVGPPEPVSATHDQSASIGTRSGDGPIELFEQPSPESAPTAVATGDQT